MNENTCNERPLALLIDDNLMSALRIEPQLKQLDYRVWMTRDLPHRAEPAAQENRRDETPQLIIINLGSRGLNGVDFVENCRERFPNSRVLGFCGHMETEIRRAARAKGIHKILTNEQALSNLANSL